MNLTTQAPLYRLEDLSSSDRSQVGGKVMPLARLAASGLPVPAAVVIPVRSFQRALYGWGLMDAAQNVAKTADLAQASALRQQIAQRALPRWLTKALRRASGRLGDRLAVRSSAVDEDGGSTSFAGQYESVLNVGADALADAVRTCWCSLYSERALAYRSRLGKGPAPGGMAVLVQTMINPDVSGVMFTINPMNGSWREMTVEAVWGLGEALVSGQVSPHFYLVRRPRRAPRPVRRVLSRIRLHRVQQDTHPIESRLVMRDGGVVQEPTPAALLDRPTLDRQQLLRLCRMGLRVEAYLKEPQDVEWALDQRGRLWLLQARPVTTRREARPRRDVLWTRRFLGERFPHPPPTLTWSLIQPQLEWFIAYPDVQDRYLGGGPAVRLINSWPYLNSTIFSRLAFKLPGMPAPRFMVELMPPDEANQFRRRFGVLPDLSVYGAILRTTVREERWRRFRWNPFTNPRAWRRFESELLSALPLVSREPTSQADAALLVQEQLELLRRYVGVHVCSLLFANIWDQVVEGLLSSWFPAVAADLYEGLATTPPGNKTLEINQALWSLAQLATSADLQDLSHGQCEPPFADHLRRFLQDYGHRSAAGWDVFAPRWRERPAALVPLLRLYHHGAEAPDERAALQQRAFEAAHAQLQQLTKASGQGAVLEYLVPLLRDYLLLRENQRFRFEQLQWATRQTLDWMGRSLVSDNIIDHAVDIQHLTWHEVRGLIDGSLTDANPREWIERRRAQLQADSQLDPPGFVRGDEALPTREGRRRLQGLGISSGRVTGVVRRIRSLDEGDKLRSGEILVARAVDPAWTPLFLIAEGIILEMGSRLSHGAVVAREYQVPAVVNIDGAMATLKDGQQVTIDGARGLVWVH